MTIIDWKEIAIAALGIIAFSTVMIKLIDA